MLELNLIISIYFLNWLRFLWDESSPSCLHPLARGRQERLGVHGVSVSGRPEPRGTYSQSGTATVTCCGVSPPPPVLTLKPQLLVPPDAAALEEKVLREMIKTRLSGRSPNPTAPGPSQERRRRQDEREGKSTREHSEKAADCEATRGLRKSRTCRT